MSTHNHICLFCKISFKQRYDLQTHIMSTHCIVNCKQVFKEKNSLLMHNKSILEGMKNKCTLCRRTKTFQSRAALLHHLKVLHGSEMLINCLKKYCKLKLEKTPKAIKYLVRKEKSANKNVNDKLGQRASKKTKVSHCFT